MSEIDYVLVFFICVAVFMIGIEIGMIWGGEDQKQRTELENMSCDEKGEYIIAHSSTISDSFMNKYLVQCKAPISEKP